MTTASAPVLPAKAASRASSGLGVVGFASSVFAHLAALVLFVARAIVWFVRRALSLPAYNYLITIGLMYAFHEPILRLPLFVVEAFVLGQVASFTFDVIHYTLHAFHRSKVAPLRALGGLHDMHHRFLDRELQIQNQFRGGNNLLHVLPEFGTRVAVCLAALVVLPAVPVVRVVFLECVALALFFKNGGNDGNHVAHPIVRAASPSFFVDTFYHSLHHLYPGAYFSSIHTTFDRVFGTGCMIRERRAMVVGGSEASPLEDSIRRQLAFEGASLMANDARPTDEQLLGADLLVICPSIDSNATADSHQVELAALVDRFRALKKDVRFPSEVWGIARASENAPRPGTLAAVGRRYYDDTTIAYRHVVVADEHATDADAERTTRFAFFLIRRGFRYVPATATGKALLQFFRFDRLRVAG